MQTSPKRDMIMSPHKIKTKGDVRMKTLYQKARTMKSLKEHFQPYLSLMTKPSGKKLFLLLLSMTSMQFITSISHLYKWFLSDVCGSSLNSYYYLLSYVTLPLDAFLKVTVRKAVALIPKELAGLPVLLVIDDTLQAKFGTHFECYQTMFDHARHNGSSFLKGHCFVALTINVPVVIGKEIRYLSVPLAFRLRGRDESKLLMASRLVDAAMEELRDYPMAILLCDSWYPKSHVLKTVERHENLDLIANMRVDTCLYDLPPPRTKKRGRPAKKGGRIDLRKDMSFILVGGYHVAVRRAMTNLFQHPVYVTVTSPNLENPNSFRLFVSTLMPEAIEKQFRGHERRLSDSLNAQMTWTLPLFVYSFRWSIEVCFYEMKTFWSFGSYLLRSKRGVENYVSLIAMNYAGMRILPLSDPQFASLADESVQTAKYAIGNAVQQELFLWRFVSKTETGDNCRDFFKIVAESGLDFKHSKAS